MTLRLTLISLAIFSALNSFAQKAFDEYILPKTYVDQGSFTDVPLSNSADVQVNLFTNSPVYPVRQSLFGQNAVAWQKDIDETSNQYTNYNNANYSMLRYPGGNWSNIFFWDGNIPSTVLTDDVVTATTDLQAGNTGWFLGTDEFPDLLDFTGSDGIVCVNVGWSFYGTSADPVETAANYAADWVDHYNNTLGAGIKYWELGNENYGEWQAGYSFADPAKYANACIEFYNKMKAVDPDIELGVVLYEGEGGLYPEVQGNDWNEIVLPIVKDHMDFIIIHQYPHPSSNRNDISEEDIYEARASLAEVVEVIGNQVETYTGKAKDHYPISVTEFNSRTGVRELSRSNSLFTSLFLGEMASHNIGSAMQWSLDNGYADDGGGHGAVAKKDPFMTDGDANSSLYVYYYMDKYFGDTVISSSSSNEDIIVYGTTFSSGEVGAVIVNIGSNDHVIDLDVNGEVLSDRYYYHQIKGDESDFDRTLYVNGVGPSNSYTEGVEYCNQDGDICATATAYEVNGVGGPQNYTSIAPYSTEIGSALNASFSAPAHSVTFMVFKTSSDECAIPDLGGAKTICSTSSIELNTQLSLDNKTFEWKNEADETIGTSNTLNVNSPGTYTVYVDSNSCVVGDEVIVSSDLIQVTHDTICTEGTVELAVDAAGTFNWYNDETGGTSFLTGSSYSPTITETDTFYVEDANTSTVYNFGKSAQDGTILSFSEYDGLWKQQTITVESDLTLTSVSVFINTNDANIQLNIYEADGTTLVDSYNYNNLASGKQVLSIGESLIGGNTYVIDLEGSDVNIVDWQDDNISDNSVAGYISFLNFTGWGSAKYGFFYDWVITVDEPSPCARTPIFAVIDPAHSECITVDMQELINNKISVFPNPTDQFINIQINEELNIQTIELIDITGKTVLSITDFSTPINVSHLEAGIYLIKVQKSNTAFIINQKAVIQK